MAQGDVRSRLRRLVIALSWLATMSTSISAAEILVREEFGFSFFPGMQWVLEEGGPAVIYDLTASFGAGALFDLSYANNLFLMTALGNNTAGIDSLPFGLDVYPVGVTPLTPDFDCAFTMPCYDGFGFIAMLTFPREAGEFVSVAIPLTAAVDEPATSMLFAAALAFLLLTRVHRRVLWATAPARRCLRS
jgi:hypothetical protein